MIRKLVTRILIGFALLLLLVPMTFSEPKEWDYETITDTVTMAGYPDPSLPHTLYQRILDSMALATENELYHLKSGTGVGLFSIGVTRLDGQKPNPGSAGKEEQYFFTIGDYSVSSLVEFTVKDGRMYQTYPEPRPGTRPEKKEYYMVRKELPARFSPPDGFRKTGTLMIPVSKTRFHVLQVIFYILSGIVGVFLLIGLVIRPYQVLYRVSQGNPFDPKNIRGMTFTGWALVVVSLLPVLIAIVFEALFTAYTPYGAGIITTKMLAEARPFIIAAVIVALLVGAFRKGADLQKEQDLTI